MCGIGRAIFGTQGDGSLVIMEAKKRGEKSPRFCYVSVKICCFFVKNFSSKTALNPSIYKALSHFCVIITTAGSNKVLSAAENLFSRAA